MRLVALAAIVLLGAAAQERLPVPDAAALKEAETAVRERFKEEYRRNAPSDRKALAAKLMEEAGKEKDAAARFVMLRDARDLAAQAGDAEMTMRAAGKILAAFEGDALETRTAALRAVKARELSDLEKTADLCLGIVDEAMKAGRFDLAVQLGDCASSHAKRARERKLTARVDAKSKEISDLKKLHEEAKKVEQAMAADDPAARLTMGRYLAFVRGDWNAALPHLSVCSDDVLKGLTAKEAAVPAEPQAQIAIGDGWWTVSEKQSGLVRANVREHAVEWYRRALDAGLDQAAAGKVLKRIAEYRWEKGSEWESVQDPKLFEVDGMPDDPIKVNASAERAKVAYLSKFPTGEFDGFSARVQLSKETCLHAFFILEREKYMVGCCAKCARVRDFGWGSDKWQLTEEKEIPPKAEYELKVLLVKGEYVVYVDGEPKLRSKTPAVSIKDVGLRADNGPVAFTEARLRYKK